MNKDFRLFALILGLTIIALVIVGCGVAEPEPTPTPAVHPGKALVEGRCGTCHGVARVNTANFSREGWGATIDQMIALGAKVNDEQKEMIVDYLVSTNTE